MGDIVGFYRFNSDGSLDTFRAWDGIKRRLTNGLFVETEDTPMFTESEIDTMLAGEFVSGEMLS